MRKCVVKVMELVMCIGIFIIASVTVEANETFGQSDLYGERANTMEEYEEYLAGLSVEEMEARDAKLELAMVQEFYSSRMARAVSCLTIPGTFTMYQQQKSYYCIPACIQSILMYINGTSPS